jgi:TP901 family phage tail tape measure protein
MSFSIGRNILRWEARIDTSKLQGDVLKTKSLFSDLAKSIGPATMMSGIGVAAGMAIREFIKVNVAFEKSISTLSSITGAVGEDLEFYKKKAIEFGSETTSSASEVAEAFKLIGSQRPELLKTKDALAQVTKEAIILAEAAELDVPTAAKALTTALNNFQAPAYKSAEYINIMAAGAKEGAGEIPYITAAVEKAGAVAYDANLDFADLVTAIELLAPAISEPTSAGLHLKNVLLRLQKEGFGLTTGVFNLQEALNGAKSELNGIKDPAERASREIEIFGTESITAGKVLMGSVEKMDLFKKSITGTNSAYEQANINTQNVSGQYKRFQSAIEGLILTLGESGGLNSKLADTIGLGTELIQSTQTLVDIFNTLTSTTSKTNESLEGFKKGILNAIVPIRGMIKYNTLLTDSIKDVLQWLNVMESDDTKKAERLRESIDALQSSFNNLDPKYQKELTAELMEADKQYKNTRNITEYMSALKRLAAQIEELKGKSYEPELFNPNSSNVGTGTESEYEKKLNQFNLEKDLELARAEFLIENDFKLSQTRKQIEIDRLQFVRDNSDILKDIEKEILDEKINLMKRELLEYNTFAENIIKDSGQIDVAIVKNTETFAEQGKELTEQGKAIVYAFSKVGEIIEGTFADGEYSAEKFRDTLRTVTIDVISMLISKAIANVVASVFEKYGEFGLILAPILAGATKAVLNAAIPKFATGKPADFSNGAMVGGSGNRDNQLGLFKPNEIVLNQKQQANLLWSIAKGGIGNNKVESLLSEQNNLIRNSKQVIIKDNVMYIVVNGKFTGEKTLL